MITEALHFLCRRNDQCSRDKDSEISNEWPLPEAKYIAMIGMKKDRRY
jgi:hypothetical protein